MSGENLGFEQGEIDFNNKQVKDMPITDTSKTEYWMKGYTNGYNNAVKLMKIVERAKEKGYQQGLLQEEISIPSEYISENKIKIAFEKGFINGQEERIIKLYQSYEENGYNAGFDQIGLSASSDDVPEAYILSFEKGYTKGNKAKENEAYQAGYVLAFSTIKYQIDMQYEDHENLQKQHKNGFVANKEAGKLLDEAYEVGKSGQEIAIPEKLVSNEAGVTLYKKYYQKGIESREDFNVAFFSFLTLSTGIAGAYYQHRRKLRKRL